MSSTIQKFDLLKFLPSFWSTQTAEGESEKIFSLATLPANINVVEQFVETTKNIFGGEKAFTGNAQFTFNFSEVYVTDSVPNKNPAKVLPANQSDLLDDPNFFYIIKFEKLYIPYSIQTQNRLLFLGIDFYYAFNYLWFVENPITLFPEGAVNVHEKEEFSNSLYNFTFGTNTAFKNIDLISNYLRNTQNRKSLKLALASILNLPVIRKGGYLYGKKIYNDHVAYVFENESINVYYEHEHLYPGAIYEKDQLIDDPIFVLTKTTPDWYKVINWSDGLSLDNFTHFNGLSLKNEAVNIEAVSINTKYNKIHVRFPLNEEIPGTADKYWAHIHEVEDTTGNFLNDILELQNVGDTKQENAIDLFFRLLLNRIGIIIIVDETKTAFTDEAILFLRQNIPFGHVPFIFNSEIPAITTDKDKFLVSSNFNTLQQ